MFSSIVQILNDIQICWQNIYGLPWWQQSINSLANLYPFIGARDVECQHTKRRPYGRYNMAYIYVFSTYLNPYVLGLFRVLLPSAGMRLLSFLTAFSVLAVTVQQNVDSYITSETPIAKAGVLANIGPNGSKSSSAAPGIVIASPSSTNPDYLFTWTRDSSLVGKSKIETLEELLISRKRCSKC